MVDHEVVKSSIESAMIEDFAPTKQGVEQIKNGLDNNMTMDEWIAIHKNKNRAFTEI